MTRCTEPTKKITGNMDHIRIAGYRGTWYTIDSTIRNGRRYYLLEHTTYGDETCALIVTPDAEVIGETFDDIENGLDDNL